MMRKLISNNKGNVGTIILAVATAITLAISILIVYSVLGGMNVGTLDKQMASVLSENATLSKHASNATNSLIVGLGTFFTIAPIYLVVLIAVAIIGAVMGIMVVRRRQ